MDNIATLQAYGAAEVTLYPNSHRGFDIDEHFEKLAETYEELPRRLHLLKVGSRDPDVEEDKLLFGTIH